MCSVPVNSVFCLLHSYINAKKSEERRTQLFYIIKNSNPWILQFLWEKSVYQEIKIIASLPQLLQLKITFKNCDYCSNR